MLRFFRGHTTPCNLRVMWSETDGRYFGEDYFRPAAGSISSVQSDFAEITYAEARAILADRPQKLRDEFERLVREYGNCPETPKSSPPLPANGEGWDKPSPLIDDPIEINCEAIKTIARALRPVCGLDRRSVLRAALAMAEE